MAKITIVACPHSKKYDESVAEELEKRRCQAYFLELPSDDATKISEPRRFKASYGFAKSNGIYLHYVDSYELLKEHTYADDLADFHSYYLINSILGKEMGCNIIENIGSTVSVPVPDQGVLTMNMRKTDMKDHIEKLVASYKKSEEIVRKRSRFMAEMVSDTIDFNQYQSSLLQVGNAHTDVADSLKNHEKEIILLGEEDRSFASNISDRQMSILSKMLMIEFGISMPEDMKKNAVDLKRRELESVIDFVCRKMTFEDFRKSIYEIYL